MDERQYFNRDFNGSASYGCRSVNMGHGLKYPPGFEPKSNHDTSPHCHTSIMKLAPSKGSTILLDHIPPPGFPRILKKKRGRPQKSPRPAVGTPGVSTADLSKLKPPSISGGFRTGEEYVKLLKSASSVLISGIKEAANANEMIELSSKAFIYFDSIGIDYMPLYKSVCSVIHHHCDKEALAKKKPHYAFDTIVVHDQAAVELSEAKERYARVNQEVEDAQCDFDAITTHLNRLYEEINKGKAKQAKLEAKVAAAKADKVTSHEAYSKAKSKMEKIAPKMSEARKAIDEFERRWKETMDGLNRAMEETSSLGI